MSIQFGNNLKVFVTTNIDGFGNINSTGFTTGNTREIVIIKDSLSATQQKDYQYISGNSIIDTVSRLESVSQTSLTLGDLSFGVYLNSASTGPYDIWVWNALTNEAAYPGAGWTLSPGNLSMQLARTSAQTKDLGILVVSDGICYLFDRVRAKDVGVSFDLSNLVENRWNFNFEQIRNLGNVTSTRTGNTWTFSGGLTGSGAALDLTTYKFCAARTVLLGVYDANNVKLGSLAATNLNLNIANNPLYLEDVGIDRAELGYKYVESGGFSISGGFGFYTRESPSYSSTFLSDLVTNLRDSNANRTYTFVLELRAASSLCDIKLTNCAVSLSTEFSSTLTNTVNFKVLGGTTELDSFIKFYT